MNHHLIICSHSINEINRVIANKFPSKLKEWDQMLNNLDFELIYTPLDLSSYKSPEIRDPQDLPILISALKSKSDMFITGDKDFHTTEIREYIAVYTPDDFLRNFG